MSNVATAPNPLRVYEYSLPSGDSIHLNLDDSRDDKLTPFGKATLKDRYLVSDEKPQDLFARVASYNSNDAAGWDIGHAQRMYDYMSNLWFMPATPVLSNSGLKRGLPISCFLNSVGDSMESIAEATYENIWLAAKGGGIGCVDSETEYLTPLGWKPIDTFTTGDEVMVVEPDGSSGRFEHPEKYVQAPATDMYHFTGKSLDMVVSGDHRNLVSMSGDEVFEEKDTRFLLQNNRYKRARLKPSVKVEGGIGLPYTEIELRFLVALAADGSNVSARPDVKFGLRHHRKIERLRLMLAQLGIEHEERQDGITTNFYIANRGVEKRPLTFENFGEASAEQIETIFDELGYWGGGFDQRNSHLRFSTMKADEADFVQYIVMAATGRRAGLGIKTCDGEYNVRETSHAIVMAEAVETFAPLDGKQYCFQTSTTYWLARRGGTIFVTGNTSWSDVRSIDEPIDGSMTGKTSGIIPFIHWQDAQTLAISQGSLRRGSAAAYLDDRHPEIEEFIDIRRPTGGDHRRKAQNLHHGIMLSDAFMNAVLADTPEGREWELHSPKTGEVLKVIDARDLWIKILLARLETGEPYIIFADTVNKNLPAIYNALGLKVRQSNLCSEITLHTGPDHHDNWRTAVCCLSSLNMETMDEWSGNEQFIKDVLEFLDNVLTNFITKAEGLPGFERAIYSAKRERSVGLGIMGFHSYLQSKMIPFESKQARSLNKRVWAWLSKTASKADIQMADERGESPDSADARAIDQNLNPSRLTNKFSIAPTASISIIAGGASACGEPWPANSFVQKTLGGSFAVRNRYLDKLLCARFTELHDVIKSTQLPVMYLLLEMEVFKSVYNVGLEEWIEDQWSSITINGGSVEHLPYLTAVEKAVFRTAIEIDQRWVIWHAGDRSEYICQAQSVNIFLPPTVEKKDLHMLHVMAWTEGLKSVYYLRSQSVRKAMAVTHVAGEMPKAKIDTGVSIYDEEPVCESCQ